MGISNKYNIKLGIMEKGENNLITDVPGVKVGNITLSNGNIQTGITAVIPCEGDVFLNKPLCASHVVNGFGKSIGLVQIDELGTLETPILLTNTFSVPTGANALLKYMLKSHKDIGDTTSTVNPVVMECNDGVINDIRGFHVTEDDCLKALENAGDIFEEGAVGAGRGMICYSLKGGIGSSSRVLEINGEKYTVGTLLLTNFGTLRDLTIGGEKIGEKLYQIKKAENEDKGSCIMIIATDAPLSARQLKRLCKRAQSGLARTGTISGNGSGEISLAFTAKNRIPHYPTDKNINIECLHDDNMNILFRAVIESVEESVISSLLHAETVTGRNNYKKEALGELIEKYNLL